MLISIFYGRRVDRRVAMVPEDFCTESSYWEGGSREGNE